MENCEKEPKYAYIDQLGTDELENLLRTDTGQSDGSDIELILHVTEILLEREERGAGKPIIDVESAWKDFQQYFNTPDAAGRSLYPIDEDETIK